MASDKRNLARASSALRTGGKPLAKLTGNPADAGTQPKPLKSQQRLRGIFKAGFRKLGK